MRNLKALLLALAIGVPVLGSYGVPAPAFGTVIGDRCAQIREEIAALKRQIRQLERQIARVEQQHEHARLACERQVAEYQRCIFEWLDGGAQGPNPCDGSLPACQTYYNIDQQLQALRQQLQDLKDQLDDLEEEADDLDCPGNFDIEDIFLNSGGGIPRGILP